MWQASSSSVVVAEFSPCEGDVYAACVDLGSVEAAVVPILCDVIRCVPGYLHSCVVAHHRPHEVCIDGQEDSGAKGGRIMCGTIPTKWRWRCFYR